jgi:prolyl oligopeptidase
MVRLSRGGRDAAEIREFDMERRAFVEDGFFLPEARTFYEWKDANTLYVATDFGEGTTTRYGWPRIVKVWKRGTSLDEAQVLFEADSTDRMALPIVERFGGRSYHLIVHVVSRYETNHFVLENGQLIRLDMPGDARIRPTKDQLVILLNSDWIIGEANYAQGTLLSIDYDDFLSGSRDFEVIFEPDERAHVNFFEAMENFLLVNMLHNARSELYRYRREDGRWTPERVAAPDYTSTYLASWDRSSGRFFFTFQGFLTPPTLGLARNDGTVVRVRHQPAFFEVESFIVMQHEATSRDGTKIPYFIVHHREMKRDGHNPTLLYGYGGYRTPMLPSYEPVVGTAWLERGGVYVLANIRGGGEFGPRWHQAALRENRQRAFDDFIAVAEDLIARDITSPKHLSIMGHSNGGLLVGAVFTQRPDLFNAVACLNPVLDLQDVRDDELGDADNPDDWAYMKKYSPYHNVSRDKAYPRVLFITGRTDDRVPPGDARKMAAKMEGMGYDVYFYESEEGGHGGAVSVEQRAFRNALIYSYLLNQLR